MAAFIALFAWGWWFLGADKYGFTQCFVWCALLRLKVGFMLDLGRKTCSSVPEPEGYLQRHTQEPLLIRPAFSTTTTRIRDWEIKASKGSTVHDALVGKIPKKGHDENLCPRT